MLTYSKLGKNGRFGNQLFQIAGTIGTARGLGLPYAFPVWYYQKYFVNDLPICKHTANSLNGYLQDYKLFEKYEGCIRSQFVMKFPEIDMGGKVFIHFRAYSKEGVSHYHPEQTKEYYEQAVRQFEGKQFVVFSDDIERAKKVLPSEFIFQKGSEMWDFYIMTKCDGAIISNSTFAWWAAWLQNKKTVIPKNWFTKEAVQKSPTTYNSNGLYLPNWIAL